MSNNANYVSVGKPMIGGAVFRAPLGTTLPTNATATLGSAFENMGYISEDGVTNNNARESENIKAWGGDTVLSPQTNKTDTFGMTFLEVLNATVLKAVHGDDNVDGDISSGITVKVNSKELEAAAWVIDMEMTQGVLKRIVIPNGKITEISEVSYKDNAAVGYKTTITAFPGTDGDSHKEYIVGADESES